MPLLLTILVGTVRAALTIINLCFLVRALLSWLPVSDENPILRFVHMVTEPLIIPIRALFEHFGWFQDLPIDIAFTVTYVLLVALGGILI